MEIKTITMYYGIKRLIQALTNEDQFFEVRTEDGNFNLTANNKDFWPLIVTAKHKDDFMYIWNTYLKKHAKFF